MTDQLLPPDISGSISICSHSVSFKNAKPEAWVILERIRNGMTQEVGMVQAKKSTGSVLLNSGEDFQDGDLVKVYQKTTTETSLKMPDNAAIKVHKINKLNPPQASALYQCSQTLILEGMVAGTTAEVIHGSFVIGKAEADTNGKAVIGVTPANGLPTSGTILKVRQTCSNNVLESDLPPVVPSGVPGLIDKLDAPKVVGGFYDCSRSLTVTNIYPGATVWVKGSTWSEWHWHSGGSLDSIVCIPLPVALTKGELVEVSQEIAPECGKKPGVFKGNVAPWDETKNKLCKPRVEVINCNTSPTMTVYGLKPEVDVKIDVYDSYGFYRNTYKAFATVEDDCENHTVEHCGNDNQPSSIPLPQNLPNCWSVRVSQGECDHWSDQSDPQTINQLIDRKTAYQTDVSYMKLLIATDLFDCQNTIPVKNIFPVAGRIHVQCKSYQGNDTWEVVVPVLSEVMSVHVPSLAQSDTITVLHEVCGQQESDAKEVKPHGPLSAGEIEEPLSDGDTFVTVTNVTAGAYVELWDANLPVPLDTGYAPLTGSDRSTVVFSNFVRLRENQMLFIKLWHCGKNLLRSERTAHVGPSPDLDQWLNAHPNIGKSMVWEDSTGSYKGWSNWTTGMKDELQNAFNQARMGDSILQLDWIPVNAVTQNDDEVPESRLKRDDAWAYYKASVAQSLAVEIGRQVLWSLNNYTPDQLAQLFNSNTMFIQTTNGFELDRTLFGKVVPATPAYIYRWLRTNDLIGSSRVDTVVRVLTWCRDNLVHFSSRPRHTYDTVKDFYDVWQYRGFPPMISVMEGTTDPLHGPGHYTDGCWGTTGLLRGLLSAINIPVQVVVKGVITDPNTGEPISSGHSLPWFMADDLYLSHGDDPYERYLNGKGPLGIGGVPPIPIEQLLINANTFNNWFGAGVADEQIRANIGRQVRELAIQYLPHYLLSLYCGDKDVGRNHATGDVLKQFVYQGPTDPQPVYIYDLTTLERMKLWDRMDVKITALCSCANFHNVN